MPQVRVSLEGQFGAVFGGGSQYAMDNTACVGGEDRLTDCPHAGGGRAPLGH